MKLMELPEQHWGAWQLWRQLKVLGHLAQHWGERRLRRWLLKVLGLPA